MKTNCHLRLFLTTILIFGSIVSIAQKKDDIPPPPPPADSVVVSDKIFDEIEVEASVNMKEWREHLEKKLVPVIEKAARRMKPGTYVVNVRFIVERDGSISEVQALNDPGHGLASGAVKVVKTGPRWAPGEQNGRKVRSYHTQPITFVITAQ